MNHFILAWKQVGEGGCGHSIACGMAYVVIDTNHTREEILELLADPDEGGPWIGIFGEHMYIDALTKGHHELEELYVIPIEEMDAEPVDLDELRKPSQDKDDALAKKEVEEAERAEYERLREKFGDTP